MKFLKHFLFSIGFVIALSAVSACAGPISINKAETAAAFVKAVNGNDAKEAVRLTATPLSIHSQEWESAADGRGFVLGKATDVHLVDRNQVNAWFAANVGRITVEGDAASKVTTDLIRSELDGLERFWRGLDVYLFLRGMADVEHVFVVGIDRRGMVVAVYFN